MLDSHPHLRTLALATGLGDGGRPVWVYTPGEPPAWRLYSDGEGSPFTIFGDYPGADHHLPCLSEASEGPDPERAGFELVLTCFGCEWLSIRREQLVASLSALRAMGKEIDRSFLANVRPDLDLAACLWRRSDLEITDSTAWPLPGLLSVGPEMRVFFVPGLDTWFVIRRSSDGFTRIVGRVGLDPELFGLLLLPRVALDPSVASQGLLGGTEPQGDFELG